MKWFLQIACMISDLAVFIAAGYVLWTNLNIATLILAIAALRVWYNTGGFEAWRPSKIRQFMRNAKEIGL